jgi:hypothetical protein
MRRIALLLLALCLTVGTTVGCKEDTTTTPAPAADPAAPAGDADADGDANATDEAPADPAAK